METLSSSSLIVRELNVKLEESVRQSKIYVNDVDKLVATAYQHDESLPIEESSWVQLVSERAAGELSRPHKRSTDIIIQILEWIGTFAS
jgi:tRNA uridine 5-carbamoylmethylation protein Kti12